MISDFIQTGQWFLAPHGVPVFDGRKESAGPRPIVALHPYGGFLTFLGRSTKPLDDATHKKEHQPHNQLCDGGKNCKINERGYVSIRTSDVIDPLLHKFSFEPTCTEPDEDFIDMLMSLRLKR
jgi:hypothetical protein